MFDSFRSTFATFICNLVQRLHFLLSWRLHRAIGVPLINEIRIESLLEIGHVELLIVEPEADVEEESNESKKWNDQSDNLPVSSVFTVRTINISFGVADQQEPKNTWNEVLDGEAPIESECWLPA